MGERGEVNRDSPVNSLGYPGRWGASSRALRCGFEDVTQDQLVQRRRGPVDEGRPSLAVLQFQADEPIADALPARHGNPSLAENGDLDDMITTATGDQVRGRVEGDDQLRRNAGLGQTIRHRYGCIGPRRVPDDDDRVFPALPVVSDGLFRQQRPFKLIMHTSMDTLSADIRGKVVDPRREHVHEAAQHVDVRFRRGPRRLSGYRVRAENRPDHGNGGCQGRKPPQADHQLLPNEDHPERVQHCRQIGIRKLPPPPRLALPCSAPTCEENRRERPRTDFGRNPDFSTRRVGKNQRNAEWRLKSLSDVARTDAITPIIA